MAGKKFKKSLKKLLTKEKQRVNITKLSQTTVRDSEKQRKLTSKLVRFVLSHNSPLKIIYGMQAFQNHFTKNCFACTLKIKQ